jgi:hypothetical protein
MSFGKVLYIHMIFSCDTNISGERHAPRVLLELLIPLLPRTVRILLFPSFPSLGQSLDLVLGHLSQGRYRELCAIIEDV